MYIVIPAKRPLKAKKRRAAGGDWGLEIEGLRDLEVGVGCKACQKK